VPCDAWQSPTAAPTFEPTAAPTASPTGYPTAAPTSSPTEEPTASPTEVRHTTHVTRRRHGLRDEVPLHPSIHVDLLKTNSFVPAVPHGEPDRGAHGYAHCRPDRGTHGGECRMRASTGNPF
jgi:hypothetical protein